jgi:hypothetical protein
MKVNRLQAHYTRYLCSSHLVKEKKQLIIHTIEYSDKHQLKW